MHVLLVLAAVAFARGDNAEPAEEAPDAPRIVRSPPFVQAPAAAPQLKSGWEWVPSDGIRPGLWVTHPPLEFALDLLGAPALQACAASLGEDGKAACVAQVTSCQRLVLPASGALRLELDAACMREALPPQSLLRQVPSEGPRAAAPIAHDPSARPT